MVAGGLTSFVASLLLITYGDIPSSLKIACCKHSSEKGLPCRKWIAHQLVESTFSECGGGGLELVGGEYLLLSTRIPNGIPHLG